MNRRCVLPVALSLACLAGNAVAQSAEPTVARYCRFQAGKAICYGLVEGDRVRQIEGDLFGTRKTTEKTFALAEVKLLVPTRPTKVLALAGNYQSHLDGQGARKAPELFLKPPSCLIPGGAAVVLPPGTETVHPEGELVIVIGKRARKVSPEKAKDFVLGVTCGNDISARDWQKNDVQWWRAKGCDTFGPCGPWVAVGAHYDDLLLTTRVNGEIRQQERTSKLIHNVAAIVSYASQFMTLEPGDLIFTGTSGKTRDIKPGDQMEVELEGVGVLKNNVQGPARSPKKG